MLVTLRVALVCSSGGRTTASLLTDRASGAPALPSHRRRRVLYESADIRATARRRQRRLLDESAGAPALQGLSVCFLCVWRACAGSAAVVHHTRLREVFLSSLASPGCGAALLLATASG